MLAALPADQRQAFVDAKCDETDADLLVGILNDKRAGGLDTSQAEARVNEHCDSRRNNATIVASVGLGGGFGLGGADMLGVANEAIYKVVAHPAVAASMEGGAGALAAIAMGAGVAGAIRLRTVRRRRKVLRSCARSLVGEVSSP